MIDVDNLILDALGDPALTPMALFAHAVRSGAEREFKTERARRDRDNLVLGFAHGEAAKRALQRSDYDALAGEVNRLQRALDAIRDEEPSAPKGRAAIPTQRLLAMGYHPLEVEGLAAMIPPDAAVTKIDFHGISTTGGRLSRQEARAYMRPATHQKEETWLAQFPPIPATAEGDGSR
jgi:hypothetical protein